MSGHPLEIYWCDGWNVSVFKAECVQGPVRGTLIYMYATPTEQVPRSGYLMPGNKVLPVSRMQVCICELERGVCVCLCLCVEEIKQN